jgi:hypothetical protein
MNINPLYEGCAMTKNRKPGRETIVPIQENAFRSATGGVDDLGRQHVDNPGQTPMKDGPS